MSNQKLKALTWEPYNMPIEDHNQPPFDLTQWSNYNYSLIHDHHEPSSSSTQLHLHGVPNNLLGLQQEEEEPGEELGAMKEMMFKIAAMQPVDINPATIHKPKRRNVRISDDPQSVAARHRRERISEKIRILQRLVPGGTKMDTASMLDEAARYVKFLKRQIRLLQSNQHQTPFLALTTDDNNNNNNNNNSIFGSSAPFSALAISNNNNNSNNDNNNNLSSSAAVGGTSYMFGGNNINIDGANHNDDTVCFNYNKFIGYY